MLEIYIDEPMNRFLVIKARRSQERDMGANNSVGPGVAVIWSPNLLLNWPEQLSDALTDWREVAP